MKKILLFIMLLFFTFVKISALTCEENKYVVNYNANKGKIKISSECVENHLTNIKPTRSGYAFLGWSKFKTSNIQEYKANDNIELNSNITLYAVWSKGFKLTFNANGGKVSKKSKTIYKYLAYGMLPRANKKGYTFIGWYTKKSGGTLITENDIVNKSKKFTLYAHYQKTNYLINYELSGGTNSSKNKTSYNITTKTFNLYSPIKKGYTFNGWYTSNKYKTKVTKIKKGTTGNKTYYAKWTPIKYSIEYNGNGSTLGKMTNQSNLKYDVSYTLKVNSFTKNGYEFTGWNTKKDGSGINYNDKDTIINLLSSNNKTITLYAQWNKKEENSNISSYNIIYHLNGGINNKDNLKILNGKEEIILLDPTKSGYTFDGWYLEDTFENRVVKIEIGTSNDIEVYAKWKLLKRNYNYLQYNKINVGKVSNKNEIINTLYSILDMGRDKSSITCEYEIVQNCIDDFTEVINNKELMSSISNYVSPFNKYNKISYSISLSGNTRVINLTITKKYSEEQIEEINNVIDNILNELNLNEMSDFEKIKWAHDYLINRNIYDTEASTIGSGIAYSAYGALINNKAVCQGYTEAMSLLLDRFNIPNLMVSSSYHVWNLIFINGEWLHLDATWDDPVYSDGHQGMIYDYYLISSEKLIDLDKDDYHVYNSDYYLETLNN